MANRRIAVLCWVGLLAMEGFMGLQLNAALEARADDSGAEKKSVFRAGSVRYQVKEIDRSVTFYTRHLGFKLAQPSGPAFTSVSNGNLTLWLSGPGSSGSRAMPDGRKQKPGGWNRFVLEVEDLPSRVAAMKKAGLRFRNAIETGPGGKQIQLEDRACEPKPGVGSRFGLRLQTTSRKTTPSSCQTYSVRSSWGRRTNPARPVRLLPQHPLLHSPPPYTPR